MRFIVMQVKDDGKKAFWYYFANMIIIRWEKHMKERFSALSLVYVDELEVIARSRLLAIAENLSIETERGSKRVKIIQK